jgi:hypothetical protein
MKGSVACLAMLLLIGGSTEARAEGRCPDGYYPTGGADVGWYGCAPMGPVEDSVNVPPKPESGWQTRWGAIATADGAFGVANGMRTKRSAVKHALSDCKARAQGKRCKLKSAYHDQCAALAWGDEVNIAFRSPDLQDAESSALLACNRYTRNCRVYYSGCSYPERVR